MIIYIYLANKSDSDPDAVGQINPEIQKQAKGNLWDTIDLSFSPALCALCVLVSNTSLMCGDNGKTIYYFRFNVTAKKAGAIP